MTSGIVKTNNFPLVKLAQKYVQMQDNGRLLSNRVSLEVVRHRIVQLAERIDLNEAPDRLVRLHTLWTELREAEDSPVPLIRASAIGIKMKLDAEFEAADTDYAAWKQMMEALDLDRKLVESEVKIAKDIQAMLTAEDAYELAAKLLAAIISTVNTMMDVPQKVKSSFLKRIQYEFTRIVGDKMGGTDDTIDADSE